MNRLFHLNDLYDWAHATDVTNENRPHIDKYGLRSFLSALRFITNTDIIRISLSEADRQSSGLILCTSNPIQTSAISLLNQISIWSDTEYRIGEYHLELFGRNQ